MYRAPPSIKTEWKGYAVRAVGNRLYFRPPTEKFQAFLVGHLRWQLGESWISSELSRPSGSRHCLVDWFEAWRSVRPPAGAPEGAIFAFRPSGAVRDLVGLADDVYRLSQATSLPRRLKVRLKHRDQFQGARYELAVAGCLARLGFAIEWHEAKAARHCEFTARHPDGDVVAVEAKSRHRAGLPHRADVSAATPERADIEGLYQDALAQNPNDRPFAIFLDVNLPPEPARHGLQKSWVQEVRVMLDKLPTPSPSKPDPHALLCVTNLGGYWERAAVANPPEVLDVFSPYARFPLRDSRLFEAVRTSLGRYGAAEEGDGA